MSIAIVKYNAGNIHSVQIALQRLGVNSIVTDNPKEIEKAEKVIFPGQGEASTAMTSLKKSGLDTTLKNLKQPMLGICLGLQLMGSYSHENDTPCLNIVNGQVKKFPPKGKVPQMGWNTITHLKGKLFHDISESSYVYFVHSYYLELIEETSAQTEYFIPFTSAIEKDNFYGVQFHPEKSGDVGAKILKNFLSL